MCQAAFASEVVSLCKFQAMLFIHSSILLVPWFIFSWLQEFESPKRKPSTLVCSDGTVSSWNLCRKKKKKKKKLVKFLPTPCKVGGSWWPHASWAKFTWFWASFPKAPSEPVRAETKDGPHRSPSLNSKCWCHSLSFPSQAKEDDSQCLPLPMISLWITDAESWNCNHRTF